MIIKLCLKNFFNGARFGLLYYGHIEIRIGETRFFILARIRVKYDITIKRDLKNNE